MIAFCLKGVDVGIEVDAMVWALPRPTEGDNVSSGERALVDEGSDGKAQQRLGKTGEAADAGVLGEPSATAGQPSQLGPLDGAKCSDAAGGGEPSPKSGLDDGGAPGGQSGGPPGKPG